MSNLLTNVLSWFLSIHILPNASKSIKDTWTKHVYVSSDMSYLMSVTMVRPRFDPTSKLGHCGKERSENFVKPYTPPYPLSLFSRPKSSVVVGSRDLLFGAIDLQRDFYHL
ncbi:hypothetical protein L1987_06999 [Smallanthus sonchifolius]|uniref:Uncharacterized protein n=1 Tax=Smallanthus sonchifolius TaxID=185202 RepID=A0ACB9JZP2_9ASTR|nr:hypothetical protein L1987_06999 [Smallanthus sonchifolius]